MKKIPGLRAMVVWAYVAEFVLAALGFTFVSVIGRLDDVASFLEKSAVLWSAFFGVLLACAFAVWIILVQFNSDDFGAYLEWKGVGSVLSGGFFFNVILFAMAAATALVTAYAPRVWLVRLAIFLDLLGLINVFTLALLVFQLTRIQSAFKLEYKKATSSGTGLD